MTAPLPERVRDRPLTDAEVEKIATNWERLSFSEKVLLSTLRHDAATIASLRAENARLTSEVERLRKRLDEAEHSAALGCESPPQGCDCPGCSLAREDSALAALDAAGGDS